jgi:hypothetical protein
MIRDIILAKLFVALVIAGLLFSIYAAAEGRIPEFCYGLCAIIVFSNLASARFKRLKEYARFED